MTRTFKTIIKISSAILFSLLIFPNVYALEVSNPVDVNGSMYKYGAIENDSISPDIVRDSLKNQLPIGLELPKDIATQLKDIAEKQKFSTKIIDGIINKIKDKSGLEIFLVGNNLSVLKFHIVQINNLIFRLNDLLKNTENRANTAQIENINSQIKSITEERIKVENFILEHNNEFSLFRWFLTAL